MKTKVAQSMERLQALRTMPYQEYLQTEEWKEKRRLAMLRADFRCQVCNSKGDLNTHHRTYERVGAERMKDLTVLCDTCHEIFHKHGRLARERAS